MKPRAFRPSPLHLAFLACTFVFPFAAAYKKADGMKIDGRRVLVDVERARTVKGWLPRRLGELERIMLSLYVIHLGYTNFFIVFLV